MVKLAHLLANTVIRILLFHNRYMSQQENRIIKSWKTCEVENETTSAPCMPTSVTVWCLERGMVAKSPCNSISHLQNCFCYFISPVDQKLCETIKVWGQLLLKWLRKQSFHLTFVRVSFIPQRLPLLVTLLIPNTILSVAINSLK